MGAHAIDALRALGLASPSRSSRRHHLLLPASWHALVRHHRGQRLTLLLTLLGAGTMGALLAMRYLPLPWPDQTHVRTPLHPPPLDLTVAGLQNMGNNCFLNVVLQALASSHSLVSFMEECARVVDEQGVQAQRASMPLAAAVADLLKELSQGQVARRILSPRRVMLALDLYTRQFDLSMQQDAAEALAHLAAGLQEEREKYLHLRRPVSQSFGTVLDNGSATPQLDQAWLHWPLEGTLGSLMACQRCGFQYSTVFEYFNDISLPLSGQPDCNMMHSCSLEDCLDRFTAPEWVASVKCSRCAHMEASHALRTNMDSTKLDVHTIERTIETIEKCSCDDDCSCEALMLKHGRVWSSVHTNASKRLRIGRAPEVLCLQVQRAVVNEMGEPRKLMGHVKFPTILDLFPYTVTGQETKLRATNTRTQEQDNFLIQMLGHRGVMLSHIRKLQGSGYPSSLFSLEPGMKGGSEVSKPTDDVESPHGRVTAEDGSTGLVTEGGFIPKDSLPEPGAPIVETSNSDEASKLDSSATPTLETSTPFCTGLGALADPLGVLTSERTSTSRKLLYELLSIVVHHGGPQSGHYTVYRKVRLPKDRAPEGESDEKSSMEMEETVVWFKVSDTNVRRVEEVEVQLANASLLLYERLRSTS